MEIILGTLALQYGVIGERLFVALVIMAIATSMLSGPLIQRILARPKPRRFAEHLGAKSFIPRLRAADRFEAIGELTAAAAAHAGIDGAAAAEAAIERERLMATGLSNGIAVPHARLAGLAAPVVAVGMARAGIDFEAPDGAPAKIIILLLTPDPDHGAQIDLLADIARAFADPVLRDQALGVGSYTEFRALLKAERAG
jgi:mannitol/fructose-specific phosphotransferase system IIA component (Ntr-type)